MRTDDWNPAVSSLTWGDLDVEARQIVASCVERGIVARTLGSVGLRLHCAATAEILDAFNSPAKDLDLAVGGRHRREAVRLLRDRGYESDRDMEVTAEGQRYLLRHRERPIEIDLFVDRLEFCHTIDLRGRLDLHPASISIEDLLLHKLQIVEVTPKDNLHVQVLLAMHDVDVDGDGDIETISVRYVAGLLAQDWGFYTTAMHRLDRLADDSMDQLAGVLGAERTDVVRARCDRLRTAIEAEPKTLRWKSRAVIGQRAQWWRDVDERRGAY